MNKDENLISVIIPVYDNPGDLRRAIRSVLEQSWQGFEIIVVDDGSESDLKIVCDSFSDKRVRYFRNEEHKNANVARNRGLQEATGVYVAMLDADDEFLPGHLERRIARIEEWQCDGIFGSAYIFDGQNERVKHCRPLQKGESMADYLLTDGFCPTPSHFYKRDAALKIGWDEQLVWHQDYDFSIRFAEKFDFRCDPAPTVRVHWHKGHKSKLAAKHFESQKRFIAKHRDKISFPALVNYFYSKKKEAREIGSDEQYKYYKKKLNSLAPGYRAALALMMVRGRSLFNKLKAKIASEW